ncbi:hypothetical protein [Desulforamulus ruminis]
MCHRYNEKQNTKVPKDSSMGSQEKAVDLVINPSKYNTPETMKIELDHPIRVMGRMLLGG